MYWPLGNNNTVRYLPGHQVMSSRFYCSCCSCKAISDDSTVNHTASTNVHY